MRVLIFNSLYHPNAIGGAEGSVRILAEGLVKQGIDVTVVSTADKDSFSNIEGVRAFYIKVPNLYWMKHSKEKPKMLKPLWHLIDSYNPFVNMKLNMIFNQEKPDIIHTNNLGGFSIAVWSMAQKRNIPIVHTIRDHYLLCPKSVMFKNNRNCDNQCLSCKVYSISRKKLSNKINAVIGVSKFILDKHLQYGCFNDVKIKTHIYNAVDTIEAKEKSTARSELITFGFIGMLSPIKGIEYLLQRFSGIDSSNARLKIFGRGITKSYESQLREEYGSENIEFVGHQSTKDIYNNLDVVVIPSLCDDSFPRVVMESYSYGLPIITSNMGGAHEMVDEGKTGFIFDPANYEKFIETIHRFIHNPGLAHEMSDACLEKAKVFSVDRLISEVWDIYKKVLN